VNRVEGVYRGALRAFRNPLLALLHRRDAPLVVALLTSVFRPDRRTVQVVDAHTEMDDALGQLRAAGYEDVADRSARELCRTWVDAGWLVRQVDDESGEVYRLSAHAVDALDVASRAGGGHARVSRSRVLTLLEAVERLADDADPDVMTRMLRLQREIKARQAELDRLDRTGEIEPVDEEQLLEAAENVLLLVRELPADFARVAESIRAIQRETVTALRQDERPTGEVLHDYLERAEHLMDATAEGRAFSGAKKLLDDPERMDALVEGLDTVLRHPFAAKLPEHQRAELRAVAQRIEAGFAEVLTAQRLASRVITTQVRHHDPLRDRQVDDLLRDVIAALGAWMPASRRGQGVDPLRRLPRADVGRVRTTLADLAPHRGVEPLPEWDDDVVGSLEHAAAWGGPRYAVLHTLIDDARRDPAGEARLDALFARADADSRRPVDLVGLLELAARAGVDDVDDVAYADTIRPDGTARTLAFEAAALRPMTHAPTSRTATDDSDDRGTDD
jgi:hypothetical protein